MNMSGRRSTTFLLGALMAMAAAGAALGSPVNANSVHHTAGDPGKEGDPKDLVQEPVAVAKEQQLLPAAEEGQVPPEGGEVHQVLPEAPEVAQVLPEAPEVAQVLPEAPEVAQVLPEAPEVAQVLPETAEAVQALAETAEAPAIDEAPAVDDPPSGAGDPVDTEAAENTVAAEAGQPPEVVPATEGDDPAGVGGPAPIVPDEGERDPDDFVSEITLTDDLDKAAASGDDLVEEAVFERREGPDGELLVGEKSVFCVYSKDTLTCDFLWVQKTVYLSSKPQVRGVLKKVSVRNIHDLKMDISICYDLHLQDVARALVVGDLPPPCASHTVLILENVGLDRLPSSRIILNASSSKITEVVLTKVDNLAALVNTKVQRLRVEETIEGEAQVTLQDVLLERLERLHLGEKASLNLAQCTVREVVEGSLALAATGNVVSEVRFQQPDGAPAGVQLKPGADLTLSDVSGSVRVAAEACPRTPPPPPLACPEAVATEPPSGEEDEATSTDSSKCLTVPMTHYFGFLLLLVLLALSVLLNLTQIFFNQPKNILTRFVHVKRTPAHYDSLKTGQERRCSDGLEYKSFQEPWAAAPSAGMGAGGGAVGTPGGGVSSQVGITVNDVDEVVLTGLRKRTPAAGSPHELATTKNGGFGHSLTEGPFENLAFVYANHLQEEGDPASYPLPDSRLEQKGTPGEQNWTNEEQYLQVPDRNGFDYNGIHEERKII